MYESPISLMITEKTREIVDKVDNAIFRAVCDVLPMVDQKELIRALQYDRGQYDKGYADGYADGKADAAEWIPVTERLPEYLERILVWCESKTIKKHVTACTYMGCGQFSRHVRCVTHWMPLPEPPKEVDYD